MDSGLVLASLSTFSCVALGLVVGLRREHSLIGSTALALLLATALWSGGLGFAIWQGPGAVARPWGFERASRTPMATSRPLSIACGRGGHPGI